MGSSFRVETNHTFFACYVSCCTLQLVILLQTNPLQKLEGLTCARMSSTSTGGSISRGIILPRALKRKHKKNGRRRAADGVFALTFCVCELWGVYQQWGNSDLSVEALCQLKSVKESERVGG